MIWSSSTIRIFVAFMVVLKSADDSRFGEVRKGKRKKLVNRNSSTDSLRDWTNLAVGTGGNRAIEVRGFVILGISASSCFIPKCATFRHHRGWRKFPGGAILDRFMIKMPEPGQSQPDHSRSSRHRYR